MIDKPHVSFSILINLLHNKKYDNKYVVLKPMISISVYGEDGQKIINKIISDCKLKHPIYKKEFKVRVNEKKELYELRLQDFDKIDSFIQLIKDKKHNYDFDAKSGNSFMKIFNKIKLIGHIHKSWNDEITTILSLKELLNSKTRTRKGFNKEQWVKKIKTHLQ